MVRPTPHKRQPWKLVPGQASGGEDLGYPTQKPLRLLERIVTASSKAGDVVVELRPPTFGVSGGCTSADPELVADIAANPSEYYVNVHNVPYPDGAIRGQLHY